MLYASELTWNGGKGVEKEYQLAITGGPGVAGRPRVNTTRHRRSRERVHARKSPPQPSAGRVRTEAPRQAQERPGPRGDPDKGELGPHGTNPIGRCQPLWRHGRDTGVGLWPPLPCRIIVEERAAALQTASEWGRRDTIWTDCSRQEDGRVGAACVWSTPSGGGTGPRDQ